MSATEVQRQQLLAFDGFLLKPLAVDDLRKALKPKKRGRMPGVRVAHPGRAATVAPATGEAVDIAVIEKLLTMMPLHALQDTIRRLHCRYPDLCPCSAEPGTPRGRACAALPTESKERRP